MARIRPGGDILELGCGNGRDSAAMIGHGFNVTPTDGTPEMAAEASRRLGVTVGVLRFEAIDARETFDGIWANACLLHVPRAALGGILARIHTALRSGGLFYASFKAGEAEGHDALGRFFNYPSAPWLADTYRTAGFSAIDMGSDSGGGYDKQPTDWLHVTAVKT